VNDNRREAPWRELGVANWARDCGFVMTKQDRLYDLWRSSVCILDGVLLDDVEHYLESL
jgi:hypothetical protein